MKKLQLHTELNFLKNQIQPHFFFNTLNNLYALIIEKSEKAKDVVVKLSKLMQYSLYDIDNEKVFVLGEVGNIQNYLELENLRYQEKVFPTLEIDGEIYDFMVPPLLYVTFIENCFKHGNITDENFKLSISFKNNNSQDLVFSVKNTFNEADAKNSKKGIGIENAKRRLQLIFKNNYTLRITTEENMFCVYLKTPIEFGK